MDAGGSGGAGVVAAGGAGGGGDAGVAAELERTRCEVVELRRELASAESQVAELTVRCIALGRLYAALDTGEVRRGIEEVVINLVGSEEFGIWEPERAEGPLLLTGFMGIDPLEWGEVVPGVGVLGRAAAMSDVYVAAGGADGGGEGRMPLACVPLRAGGRLQGVVGIFGLLPHKRDFEASDRDLLELLREHAGRALLYLRRGVPAAGEPGGCS